jgi:L-threonylcarbamoyladenylate synthase
MMAIGSYAELHMSIRLTVDAGAPEEGTIERAAGAIAAGAVVAYPTDTLYGLAVDPWIQAAVDRLCLVKGRTPGTAIPLIASGRRQVEAWAGELSPLADRLARAFWPGPLTIVIPAFDRLVPAVHAGLGTVAVRVPAHPVAIALARAAGRPITSTSANRAGGPPASTPDEVARTFGSDLDVLLDAGASPGGPPSTIVDVTGDEPRLVRAGAVPWDRVLESLRK